MEWIKVRTSLLRNSKFAALSSDAAKFLFLMWLYSSDYDGYVPNSAEDLAFNLHFSVKKAEIIMEEIAKAEFTEVSDDGTMLHMTGWEEMQRADTSTERSRACRNKQKRNETLQNATSRNAVQRHATQCNAVQLKKEREIDIERKKDVTPFDKQLFHNALMAVRELVPGGTLSQPERDYIEVNCITKSNEEMAKHIAEQRGYSEDTVSSDTINSAIADMAERMRNE